uniref:hypothetical protein n=1 Tax=Salmonella enterica TaxID=28901 RepID=UPI00398C29D1
VGGEAEWIGGESVACKEGVGEKIATIEEGARGCSSGRMGTEYEYNVRSIGMKGGREADELAAAAAEGEQVYGIIDELNGATGKKLGGKGGGGLVGGEEVGSTLRGGKG